MVPLEVSLSTRDEVGSLRHLGHVEVWARSSYEVEKLLRFLPAGYRTVSDELLGGDGPRPCRRFILESSKPGVGDLLVYVTKAERGP